ncbi:helix-turn-helix domain-containing protein [Listeria booriae]|uniref:helix-turn-helix domain-containing protein n=1 Tax=Listeria booriae TaxID=1552123 RepID=UPI0016248308|nr:helix-turn-helix domain-containing protein [Listeria booriae]MBC1231170.1 helix-turn-helix domain-containing protein [Listeria booriae]
MGVTKVLLQIEKKTNQMVQLLTTLDETITWYSIKKIAMDLGVTVSTARRYVEELQSSLPNGWEIAQQAYKGILLIKPIDQSIQAIIHSWITDTLMFKMLELGFREQASNLQAIAQQSYTSIPSLYRMIRKANEFFEKDGITISKSPFHIRGQEEDIRNFFFHLFSEVQAINTIFQKDLLAIIHEHVIQLDHLIQANFSFTEKKKIVLFVAICVYRSKKKRPFQQLL